MALRSFAAVVSGTQKPADPQELVFPAAYHEELKSGNGSHLHQTMKKSGKPAVFISEDEQCLLMEPLRFALIAKFATRHPKLDFVREFLGKQQFLGEWTVGQLDGRHLLIRFQREEDYALLFSRRSSTMANVSAKILKWTPDFDFKNEPPIVPVWVKFPGLRLHYFDQRILFSLAAAFGRPLKLDLPTFQLTRPSCARVLVELDISLSHSDTIWIGSHTNGYWQPVELEGIPYYCKRCNMFGHRLDNCFIAHPHLKPSQQMHRERQFSAKNPHSTAEALTDQDHPLQVHDDPLDKTLQEQPPDTRPSFNLEEAYPSDDNPNAQIAVNSTETLSEPLLASPRSLKIQQTSRENLAKGKEAVSYSSKTIQGTPTPLKSAHHRHLEPSSDDEDASASEDSLADMERTLNEEWQTVNYSKRKFKGSRELKALLNEASHPISSPRRALRGRTLSS